MRVPLTVANRVNQLAVASPCTVSWDAMRGDARMRFCEECRKHVYNLAEMTAVEIENLVEANEGRVCAQLFRRVDGTVLTSDCTVGVRLRIWKRLQRRAAWAASLFAMVFLSGLGCVAGNMVRPDPKNFAIDPVTAPPGDSQPINDSSSASQTQDGARPASPGR